MSGLLLKSNVFKCLLIDNASAITLTPLFPMFESEILSELKLLHVVRRLDAI